MASLSSDPIPHAQPQNRHQRRRLISLHDLHHLPNSPWLAKGLIPQEGLGVIHSPPGQGKSFFLIDIGMSVAYGLPVLGRKAQQGMVVFVAAEGVSGMRARLEGWRIAHHRTMTDAPAFVFPGAVDLLDPASVVSLIDAVREAQLESGVPVRMVVFDTLARCFGDGDENGQRDMNRAVASCDAVREALGCFVFVIHHQGKAQNGPRGSTALVGAADTVMAVKRGPFGIEIEVEKQKDGEGGQTLCCNLVNVPLGSDEDGDAISTLASAFIPGLEPPPRAANENLGKNQAALLALVDDAGAQGVAEDDLFALATAQGIVGGAKPRRAFSEALAALRTKERVREVDGRLISAKP